MDKEQDPMSHQFAPSAIVITHHREGFYYNPSNRAMLGVFQKNSEEVAKYSEHPEFGTVEGYQQIFTSPSLVRMKIGQILCQHRRLILY